MESTTATGAAEEPSPARASARRGRGFVVLLLLSGFCGISYEVLYARILSNFIGDQFAVSASILLTFMLGIGVGTLCAHRLWRWLWLIEAGIGGLGAAFALGAGALEQWFYAITPLHGSLGGAMLVCFVLLSAPSFLIGCSLPLFAGYLGRLTEGRIFARAYMVYNFGAAVTVLVIEYWLLRQLGIRATVLTMAALNGAVAVALWSGFRELREPPVKALPGLPPPRRLLPALAIASVGSAIFQLLMVKIAECFLGPYRETFALVLALVLSGIAAGAALTRRWRVGFGWLLVAGLAGLAWLVGGYEMVTRGYAWAHPLCLDNAVAGVLHRAAALAALMAVPAVAFGATIPALLGEPGNVARDSGRLLCVSSLANAAGFLLMALVLHRHFDYGVLLLVVAGLAGLAVMWHARFRGWATAAAAGLVGLTVWLHQTRWDEDLLYLSYDNFNSTEDLDWARSKFKFPEKFKGAQDTFSLNHFGEDIHFFINGYVSIRLNSPAEKLVGAFPVMFAPRTDRALVLGVGSGATAGTVASLCGRLDGVEINPVVLQNLWRMSEHNFDLVKKPNARFINDDGIHFMRVCREQYPLIINTVTSPRYFSSSKLYTLDFLESVRRRLEADGIYVTWVDARVGPRGLDIILRTVARSFRHCAVAGAKSGYFLLLCSQEPIRLRRPELVSTNAVLANYFETNGLPPRLLPYALLTPRGFDLIGETNGPLNTMDFPALEFEMARGDDRHPAGFSKRLLETMDLKEIARALEPALRYRAVDLALFSVTHYRDSSITTRRVELAGEQDEDFAEQFAVVKLDFLGRRAAAMNTAEAHHDHATELLTQRHFEEAIAAERRALALDPQADDAHFQIAFCQEKLGQFDLAIASYLAERRADPFEKKIWLGLGRVHYKLNKHEAALGHLRRAVARDDRPENHLYLSLVLKELGQAEESEAEYQRALQFNIQPDDAASTPAREEGANR